MRISDWSSDVCSSDLGKSRRAASPNLTRRRRVLPVLASVGVRRGQWENPAHGAARSGVAQALRPGGGRQWRMAVRSWLGPPPQQLRAEEHTYELQSPMRIYYAGLCLTKQHKHTLHKNTLH